MTSVSEDTVKQMMQRGQDPKEMLIEACQPECKFWKEKLQRCENTLKNTSSSDPEQTCMYPMRDYVTCVEACVQPRMFKYLTGI